MTATLGKPSTKLGLVLAVCCLAQFMNVLDASVMNVALPSIFEELKFERHHLQWVNSAYTIAVCGFLLLGGRLADLFGQRRVFFFGATLFTVASAVGGMATSPGTLIAARGFQGLGAAVMAPASLTVLGTTFRDPTARAKAFGWWSAVSGTGGAVGVLLGGIVTESLGWRWVLLINVPLGIALVWMIRRAVPETPSNGGLKSLDVPGAITVTVGLMALVYGIAQSHELGWGSWQVSGSLVLALVLFALFLRQQTVSDHPLMPLGIFRNRQVTATNIVAFFAIAALFSTFYFLTLVLQQVMGFSALATGIGYLPLSIGIALGGFGVARIVPRIGPRPVLIGGLLLGTLGLLWVSTADETSTFLGSILVPTTLLGLGMGAVLNATTNAATSGVPREQAGLASGLLNTIRQMGSAIGLVVLATMSSARADSLLAQGEPLQHSLGSGYGLALFGAGVFTLCGALAALAVPRKK
ncbi:MFS transporter [Lentzea sp. NPDC003310]|uniref:MFS transporter n=1 Tax=Lentzea sp. NPDC003310 TaxID=3154447 RepID=UPI0033B7C057